jgi:Family of unknown function (DUF5675)
MMELKLIRRWLTPASTIGELYVDGVRECFILEDQYPTPYLKVYGRTAVPTGRYEVRITQSPRFKRELPLLLNVPGYEGVRIHPGNTADDTEGCLLPGTIRGADKVMFSKAAFACLFSKLKLATGPVFLTIEVQP